MVEIQWRRVVVLSALMTVIACISAAFAQEPQVTPKVTPEAVLKECVDTMLKTPHVATFTVKFPTIVGPKKPTEGKNHLTGYEKSGTIYWQDRLRFRVAAIETRNYRRCKNGKLEDAKPRLTNILLLDNGTVRTDVRQEAKSNYLWVGVFEHGPELDYMTGWWAKFEGAQPPGIDLSVLSALYTWNDGGIVDRGGRKLRLLKTSALSVPDWMKMLTDYSRKAPATLFEMPKAGMGEQWMPQQVPPMFPPSMEVWIDPETKFLVAVEVLSLRRTSKTPGRMATDTTLELTRIEFRQPDKSKFVYKPPPEARVNRYRSKGNPDAPSGKKLADECLKAMQGLAPFTADFTYHRSAYDSILSSGTIFFRDSEHYRVEVEVRTVGKGLKPVSENKLRKLPLKRRIWMRNGGTCRLFWTIRDGKPAEWKRDADWRAKGMAAGRYLFDPVGPIAPQLAFLIAQCNAWDSHAAEELDGVMCEKIKGTFDLRAIHKLPIIKQRPRQHKDGYRPDSVEVMRGDGGMELLIDPETKRLAALYMLNWKGARMVKVEFKNVKTRAELPDTLFDLKNPIRPDGLVPVDIVPEEK
jgi:outer membrane lipoprotein-sorting protein